MSEKISADDRSGRSAGRARSVCHGACAERRHSAAAGLCYETAGQPWREALSVAVVLAGARWRVMAIPTAMPWPASSMILWPQF